MESKAGQSSEVVALIYLGLPILLFFIYFVRYELALPAILFLFFSMYQWIKTAEWNIRDVNYRLLSWLSAIAVIWVFASGGLGLFYQNGDWTKHHAILNLLSDQSWPPTTSDGTLRYYLGWYLVPAFAMKLASGHGGNFFSAIWTSAGLTLFFWLIAPLFKTQTKVLLGITAFIIFSGADIVGTWITNFERGNIMHIEWWSGWIEYSSNTTSLFWVPQHAVPAWIGIALLLRQFNHGSVGKSSTLLFLVFVGFWSPFVALGLAPFTLFMSLRFGMRETVLNIPSGIGFFLIGLPIVSYLLTNTANVPHGLIWLNGCVSLGGPCFSLVGLAVFLALEVGGAVLVMALCRVNIPASFLIISIVTLTLIPLYLVGINNDFAMRASMPAIAILALACASALTMEVYPRQMIPMLVLLIGLAVPVTEVYRGLMVLRPDMTKYSFRDGRLADIEIKEQYFTHDKIWVLRSNVGK